MKQNKAPVLTALEALEWITTNSSFSLDDESTAGHHLSTLCKALSRPAIDCDNVTRVQSIDEGLSLAYETGNPMMLWDYVEKLMEGGE